ncbi:hypothetical protein VPNG_02784 [Cytospora leucostoma]|uniref:Arb2 domain-containing protein n=1 Tax=Cytospora leucostoma TaxID=1230097 RepID=A0A423XJ46_9PEZI|nr:hypothetical protein VPNG_02784 [Cytospora leucostoma]
MFRRRWSGLPEDPVFPADLKGLGYFVDPETDEIRQISAPTYYFNYFMSKNVRYNDRQRFAFTTAIQEQLLRPRLEGSLGLVRLPLPLGTPTDEPHVPIYVSPGLKHKRQVVVIFGESEQELGVIAHRVIGGRGGIDEGSMVSIVRALHGKKIPETKEVKSEEKHDNDSAGAKVGDDTDDSHEGGKDNDEDAPGIVLANTGELWWWPEGRRGLTARQSQAVPMKSCVHWGRFYDAAVNAIPGNASVDQHVACVFGSVLDNPDLVARDAMIQVVGVADGAVAAGGFLDRNWGHWKDRVGCLAMLGFGVDVASLQSEDFRGFLKEKSRLYITCQEPLDTVISGPDGNPNTTIFTAYGCPILSSGEAFYTEMTLIRAKDSVLSWLDEVYRAGKGYTNPEIEVTFADAELEETPPWGNDPDLVGPPATTDAVGRCGAHQGPQGGGGLEIVTREEWEARMRKEGKENVPVPDDVYVCDDKNNKEEDD